MQKAAIHASSTNYHLSHHLQGKRSMKSVRVKKQKAVATEQIIEDKTHSKLTENIK
jgi:hypothetical protein